MLREKNGKGQPYSLAIRQPLSNRLHMVNGSSTSGVEFVGPIQSIPNGQLQDSPHLQGYPQHHIYSLNHFDDQDTTPPLSSPELQTQPSQSSPSPKTVHFQLQTVRKYPFDKFIVVKYHFKKSPCSFCHNIC